MASRFNALKADAAWQKVWDERKTFAADDLSTKPPDPCPIPRDGCYFTAAVA